jgi:1-acyl-sn-glycerol-3-phosphate acyltransferase
MLYKIIHALAKIIFKIFFRLTIIGYNNIPKQSGFIVSPNHKSSLDIPIVGAALPRKMYTVGKKELFNKKFNRWFYSSLGGIPIDREATGIESMRRAIEAVKNGNPLLIFPEGTRFEGTGLGKGKKGPAFISVSGRVPILPVGIAGTDKAMPKKAKLPKPTHVVVVFGKPFKAWEIFNPNDRAFLDNAIDYLMKEIEKCHEQAKEKL